MHKLKAMGASTASNGAVGLYHVENVTPDAMEKGRDLLADGYQTYVVDDAEIASIYDNFPNLWTKQDAKPTRLFLGCPHLTFHEVVTWGTVIIEELKKRGQDKGTRWRCRPTCSSPYRCGTMSSMSTRCWFAI
jgi:predicted aconitase